MTATVTNSDWDQIRRTLRAVCEGSSPAYVALDQVRFQRGPFQTVTVALTDRTRRFWAELLDEINSIPGAEITSTKLWLFGPWQIAFNLAEA